MLSVSVHNVYYADDVANNCRSENVRGQNWPLCVGNVGNVLTILGGDDAS